MQGNIQTVAVLIFRPANLQHLTAKLHYYNPYNKPFLRDRRRATSVESSDHYWTAIHADKKPFEEHFRLYKAPNTFEIVVIIPGAEDGVLREQDFCLKMRSASSRRERGVWYYSSYSSCVVPFIICAFYAFLNSGVAPCQEMLSNFCKTKRGKEDVFFDVLRLSTFSGTWPI